MESRDSEILQLPVHELVQLLARQRITATRLTAGFLDRIEREDGDLRAFVSVYADEAMQAAKAADLAITAGHRIGPLHGIPVAVKDLIDIEGKVTTCGSKVWEARVAGRTATVVRQLMAAGLVVVGKTHTVEFAMGIHGTNMHLGTPRNPRDRQTLRAPGGSSSGTGVAVAAGLVPWGVGTDTGGSVRVPSSWCGVTGLKTTIGRVSVDGVHHLAATFDTVGPICRDVEDCALLFDAMQAIEGERGQNARWPKASVWPTLRRGVHGLVLARIPAQERAHASVEVLRAYDDSVAELQGLGARIVDVSLPLSFTEVGERLPRIVATEGFANVGQLVDDPTQPVDDEVRKRLLGGKDTRAVDYLHLQAERYRHAKEWDLAFAGVDAFLLPTTPVHAQRLSEIDHTVPVSVYTRPINYVDWCALALPNGITVDHLPTSLQIACRGGDEATALRVGWALQQATASHRSSLLLN